MNDFIWVQKPKIGIVIERKEFKVMEMPLLESCSVRLVTPKLAHPEHLFQNRMLCSPFYFVNHINVKYANNSTIFKQVFIVMSGQGHDISLVLGLIDRKSVV